MKKDWEIKKLGEVCEINIGRTPERGNSKMWDKEKKTDNVWLSIADLNNAENGYISDSTEYVSDNAVPKMKLVKTNTLLMSFKLTIGRCAITKRDLFTNEAIAALPIIEKDLDLFFLKYYLENFDWAKLTEGDVKVKGKTLNKEKLKEVPITLPPLEEQKRIVKILDEKFAQLETIKANAQTNLQNAKDLFQSQLTKAFSNPSWEKKRLYELCSRIFAGGDKPQIVSKEISETCQIPIYANGITDDGLYGYTNEATVFDKSLTISARGTIGFTCIRTKPFVPIVRLLVLIPNDEINISYLKYGCDTLTITNTGSSIPQLTVPMIKDYKIPLPPLPEQKRIVEELDTLSEKVRQLQEIYTKQIANCDELKQAYLQKAFEGEL